MHKTKTLLSITFLLFSSLILLPASSKASSTPTIYVDPPLTITQINETAVNINISINQASNVSAWEFILYYKNTILNALTAQEGPFLKSGGKSTWFWIVDLSNDYNATHGRAWLTCTQLGTVTQGVDGSGTLATITFKPNGGGNTTLNLTDLVLADPDGNPIWPINSNNGAIQVLGTSDIATTNVTPLKTIVGQGYPMRINVTVENQGDLTETFNVTTYANDTSIQNKTITLTSKNSTTVTFTWSTTGFAKGNYTLSAYAWPVPGETDTADNNMSDGMVLVTLIGDVNGDRKVRVDDILAVATAFGSNWGEPKYSPNLDINDDLKIRVDDVLAAATHFGQGPW